MGVPVDQIQARVAASALTKAHSQSMDELMRENMRKVRCKSPWSWFRTASKKMYQTYEREGRGVVWAYHEKRDSKGRSAIAAVGHIRGHGNQLHGRLSLTAKTNAGGCPECVGSSAVVVPGMRLKQCSAKLVAWIAQVCRSISCNPSLLCS